MALAAAFFYSLRTERRADMPRWFRTCFHQITGDHKWPSGLFSKWITYCSLQSYVFPDKIIKTMAQHHSVIKCFSYATPRAFEACSRQQCETCVINGGSVAFGDDEMAFSNADKECILINPPLVHTFRLTYSNQQRQWRQWKKDGACLIAECQFEPVECDLVV
jgi:hypothetical protein